MINVTFAIYNGKEYSAGIKKDGRIVLRSWEQQDMKLGFFEKAIGENTIYIKYVDKKEVEELYDKRIRALYKGKEFDVIDEKENMISIVGIVGDYREFLKLGMISIDKGIYQKWIRRDEAEIRIIKEDLLF